MRGEIGWCLPLGGTNNLFLETANFIPFRDLRLTGTEYVGATEEIQLKISNPISNLDNVALTLEVTFVNSDKVPFSEMEVLTMGEFKIVDSSGNILKKEEIKIEPAAKEEFSFEIRDEDRLLTEMKNQGSGQKKFAGTIIINNGQLDLDEKYTLLIDSFKGHMKGDAPIAIKGNWKIDFTLED